MSVQRPAQPDIVPEVRPSADTMFEAATRLRHAVLHAGGPGTAERLPVETSSLVLDLMFWTIHELLLVMDVIQNGFQDDYNHAVKLASTSTCGDRHCVQCGSVPGADEKTDHARAREQLHTLDAAMSDLIASRATLGGAQTLLSHALTSLGGMDRDPRTPTPSKPDVPTGAPDGAEHDAESRAEHNAAGGTGQDTDPAGTDKETTTGEQ